MAITFDNSMNINHMIFYNSVAGTYTNRNIATGDYFNNNSVAGDIVYFSWQRAVWHDMSLVVGTPLVADAITIVWEYWNASTWQTLTVTDGTSNFTTTGVVSFAIPDGWRFKYRIDGTTAAYSGFTIRARITAVTNLTEGGANSTTIINGKDWTIKMDGGVAYIPADLQTADTAGSWGVVSTVSSYTNVTSSLWVTGTGTSFTIRNSSMLEIGQSLKRRRLITDAGSILQIGYRTGTTLRDASMVRYWNESLNGVSYNYINGTFNVYNSVFSCQQGGYFDPAMDGILDFEGAQMEMIGDAAGNLYLGNNATGSIKNTSWMAGGRTYFYSVGVTLDNLFLTDTPSILIGRNNGLITNTDFGTTKALYGGNNNLSFTAKDCLFQNSFNAQILPNASAITAYVKYTVTLDIRDEAGTAITSPNVVITNNVGTVLFTGAWSTPQEILVWSKLYLTPTDYNPITINISKAGYETYQTTVTMVKPFNEIITLKPAIELMITNKGPVIKANPENIGNDRELGIIV